MNCLRWLLVGAALAVATASAAPFVPERDSDVLETLPERTDPAVARLRSLRTAALAQSNDLRAVAPFVRAAIETSRAKGDPRYLGQAQAALSPWWNDPDAPSMAILLRATIRQGLHDFAGSIADLDRLIARQPRDLQARLTRSTALTVIGRHREAIADCEAIAPWALPLIAAICRAAPESQAGHARKALDQLHRALNAPSHVDPAVAVWGWTLAGEIATRLGDPGAAEAAYQKALGVDPRDAYLLGAYADLLLDAGRVREAVKLLAPHAHHDALLLRLVIAASGIDDERSRHRGWESELAARMDAARRRGDGVHRREEAIYVLAVENDPARAVTLARANFSVQREPVDVRLLATAARAAGDWSALRVAQDWQRATGLEDVALARLVRSRS